MSVAPLSEPELLRGGFTINGEIVASQVPLGFRALGGVEVSFP